MINLIAEIAENMIKTRPRAEVQLRPFIKNPAVSRSILSYINIDCDKLYPQAQTGDFVYLRTNLLVPFADDFTLKIKGNAEITYRGEKIELNDGIAVLHSEEGTNRITFKCTKDENGFGFGFAASTVYYPGMWASDYLYWIKPVLGGEYEGEEGLEVSALNSGEYILPSPTAEGGYIDFSRIFNSEYALALTYAAEDCKVNFNGRVYINGEKYTGGTVKRGDEIAVICKKGARWGFDGDGPFEIPQVETSRKNGCKWLLLELENDLLPEIQFKKPYKTGFWRLCDGSYIRPYLDTCFYGKWFYALMVGQYGLNNAKNYLDKSFSDYFADSMTVMSDYFEYMQYDAKLFGAPSFLERSIKLDDLDSIGTIGMNLCDLYKSNNSGGVMRVIKALERAMYTNIPRFDDGTFNRGSTMWADDTFMSCPFLARLYEITGDDKYIAECVNQLKGFYNRLYMSDKKLYSHIFFVEDNKPNRVPWGRGNGWVFLAFSEVIGRMKDTDSRKAELTELFKDFAEGIAAVHDKSGMWHQVLDMPDTYEETSCTGMFAIGMLRGVKYGWLDKGYIHHVDSAVKAITQKCIDKEYNIVGVCRGSQCSYDPMYYAKLGTVVNDDHGTGIILTLLAEYTEFEIGK